ncbi:MAG: cell division topological specificity factor MinE [Anaerolineae bacterium]|nr:cell division topological specificity factor MinE [Thermoflexales bacterium]MDW8408227.1 cell division topological specificity factor MinE [Anaerolineae bacterium]
MNILQQLFGSKNSADTAKQRLRFVLIHDRAEIPPGLLDLIKDDIIAALSNRLPIDREGVTVHFDQQGNESRVLVDVPLLNANGRRRKAERPA